MADLVKRRLTTILCADVSAYTRMMEHDEAGTLARLRASRDSMASLIARHDGRVINTWGDALIAEFASVVEAVSCSVEIQQELAVHNRDLPAEDQMWFRIGINLGDIMVENEDIYGEGVNIAARLQQIAEPGGIMISRPVYDQVKSKLSMGFDCPVNGSKPPALSRSALAKIHCLPKSEVRRRRYDFAFRETVDHAVFQSRAYAILPSLPRRLGDKIQTQGLGGCYA